MWLNGKTYPSLQHCVGTIHDDLQGFVLGTKVALDICNSTSIIQHKLWLDNYQLSTIIPIEVVTFNYEFWFHTVLEPGQTSRSLSRVSYELGNRLIHSQVLWAPLRKATRKRCNKDNKLLFLVLCRSPQATETQEYSRHCANHIKWVASSFTSNWAKLFAWQGFYYYVRHQWGYLE